MAHGQFFRTATGDRFTGIDASAFHLLGRYYYGEDIEPVLEQRHNLGFNMARVWTDYKLAGANIGNLLVEEHPDVYDRIPDFCALLARYGQYPHFTAYTGPGNHAPQPMHWTRLGEVVPQYALLSLVNEQNAHPGNAVDLTKFARIPGILCSHGSNGADSDTVRPIWDWGEYHSNSLSQWWRKVGHNAMELAPHAPMMATENTRFPDNDRSTAHAFDAAAGAALLCAGACFHSVSGKSGNLWTDLELELAKAWSDGAHSVDLDCQDFPYERLTNPPGILRHYRRGSEEVLIRE